MLTCENLSVSVDGRILFDLSFTLFHGSITIINGKNGVGKTTLLKIIAGIKTADRGSISLYGRDVVDLSRPYAIYLGHEFALNEDMTVLENLEFWSGLYSSKQMLGAAIAYLNLGDILNCKIYLLSAGNKKKVAIARLMSCNADVWLLDEVTANLDSENQYLLMNIIDNKAQNGGVIIMSTHQLLPFKIYNHIELT